MIRRMIRIALAACALSFAVNAATAATPDAITPDGGRYYGPLLNGKLHGSGRIEWGNGELYQGDFANGLMAGAALLGAAGVTIYFLGESVAVSPTPNGVAIAGELP